MPPTRLHRQHTCTHAPQSLPGTHAHTCTAVGCDAALLTACAVSRWVGWGAFGTECDTDSGRFGVLLTVLLAQAAARREAEARRAAEQAAAEAQAAALQQQLEAQVRQLAAALAAAREAEARRAAREADRLAMENARAAEAAALANVPQPSAADQAVIEAALADLEADPLGDYEWVQRERPPPAEHASRRFEVQLLQSRALEAAAAQPCALIAAELALDGGRRERAATAAAAAPPATPALAHARATAPTAGGGGAATTSSCGLAAAAAAAPPPAGAPGARRHPENNPFAARPEVFPRAADGLARLRNLDLGPGRRTDWIIRPGHYYWDWALSCGPWGSYTPGTWWSRGTWWRRE